MTHAFGYLPDHLDPRDKLYAKVVHRATPPRRADVIAKMPAVVDQGQLGSCTGNGVAACVDFLHVGKGADWAGPSSRLQIYYDERVIERTVRQDAGAQIRDGIKVVHKTGAALEALWPYSVSKFKTRPTKAAYADALNRKITVYQRLLSVPDMIDCLAAGFPFVFGFSVPAAFETSNMSSTGKMVWSKTDKVIGGHCVVGVGFDLDANVIVCRNSWGVGWGLPDHPGHFLMPIDYIGDASAASDFWTVRA